MGRGVLRTTTSPSARRFDVHARSHGTAIGAE